MKQSSIIDVREEKDEQEGISLLFHAILKSSSQDAPDSFVLATLIVGYYWYQK
jgi:hypothetical protein